MLATPSPIRHFTLIGLGFASADYILFLAGAAAFVMAPWWPEDRRSVVAGIAVGMLFALAHDAAHGSLAGSRPMNRVLATICFR